MFLEGIINPSDGVCAFRDTAGYINITIPNGSITLPIFLYKSGVKEYNRCINVIIKIVWIAHETIQFVIDNGLYINSLEAKIEFWINP
jgi:hypothetical protein